MSKRSITNQKSRYWLLSLMAIMVMMLMVPVISYADGGLPDPPIQDPPDPPPTTNSVLPDDDPSITDGVAPEDASLTKLEILLLTLMATF
jgi:hypothetical protein